MVECNNYSPILTNSSGQGDSHLPSPERVRKRARLRAISSPGTDECTRRTAGHGFDRKVRGHPTFIASLHVLVIKK